MTQSNKMSIPPYVKQKLFLSFTALIISLSFPDIHAQWIQCPGAFTQARVIFSISDSAYTNVVTRNDSTQETSCYKSADNGQTWTKMSHPGTAAEAIISIYHNREVFFSQTTGGLYRSYDYGVSWIKISPPPGTASVTDIAFLGPKIFAATNAGVFSSVDAGATWTSANDALTEGRRIRQILANGNNLLLLKEGSTQSDSLLQSTNAGVSWKKLITPALFPTNARVFAKANRIFLTLSMNLGTYFSSDGGNSWRIMSGLGAATDIDDIVQTENAEFAITNNGVSSSSDAAVTWRTVNDGLLQPIYGTRFAVNKEFLFLGTYFRGIWRRRLSELTKIENRDNAPTPGFELQQNFPNPFNPVTSITYKVPEAGYVRIVVYDVLGNESRVLVDEQKTRGMYEIHWDAAGYPSGIYFCRLFVETSRQSGSYVQTKKMTLLR